MVSLPRWFRTECFQVANPQLQQRRFHPRSLHSEVGTVEAFGCADPASDRFLLHTYRQTESSARPLILVHGANRTAEYFLDPHEDGSFRDPLPQALADAGFAVYAVTFAHNQDDNWWWCEALQEAILTVSRMHDGKPVSLVAHSKGGIAARLAATPWRPSPDCTRDLSDRVDRLILMGTPNGGVDFFFRYPSVNLAFSGPGEEAVLNWPTSWHQLRRDGEWSDLAIWYGAEDNFYPGQAQLLGRWRESYPLPGRSAEEEMTYEGGESKNGRCLGIDRVMELTGQLIPKLRLRPPAEQVRVGLLAGASPTMPGVLNDTSGPSDGIIFVESALEFPDSARPVGVEAVPFHHKALIAEPAAQAKIIEMLLAEQELNSEQIEQKRREGLELGQRLLATSVVAEKGAWG